MTEHRGFQSAGAYRSASGFTLVELMITLLVAFILLALALPSFREMSIRMKVTSNTNNLMIAINLARSEAAKRGIPVALIANTGTGAAAWGNSGWYVQASNLDTASPPNVVFTGGSAYEVRAFGPLDPNYNVTSNATTTACTGACTSAGQIVFDSSGSLAGANEVDLNVCRPDGNMAQENHIIVQQSGVATSYRGTAGSPAPSC
ncbi:MAG: GspH/FimT family pseudopilin [Xanthomonadaceae bacterium]|nr:GspH/FimT family pseudopilin [Xanthomonadaceae bacterium]MDE1885742.1 GspH/FimT family pseudopilin [Xanthomonadaceae bacterium]MDE1962229.1 GspH/FimT family pseudopilin [Xanthomonadaceae bacterium]MDE2083702.1 GspH/FimT family pseudopilin [Xanthomonadaceae bacterium]MDE2256184.1 GspH/FimT family pseudopilin [Xanthomonadaceae bacterium]